MQLNLNRKLKIALIIIGIILGAGLFAVFLYYNLYFKKDYLIKYFPKNTAVYLNLKVDAALMQNQSLNKLYNYLGEELSLNQIDWRILNHLNQRNISLGLIPMLKNNQISFKLLVLLDLSSGGELRLADYLKQNNIQYYSIKNQYFQQNILAISDSIEVINLVKDIDTQDVQALDSDISAVINLNRLSNKYSGRMLIDLSYGQKNLYAINDWRIKMLFASAKKNQIDELVLGLLADQSNLTLTNHDRKPIADINYDPNLLWSADFDSLKKPVEDYSATLAQVSPDLYYYFVQKLKDYQGIYKYDFAPEWPLIVSQPIHLDYYKNQEFVSILDLSQFIDKSSLINKLEAAGLEYLASLRPKRVSKTLPDHSEVIELVKDTSYIDLKIEKIGQYELKYYKIELPDATLGYCLAGNKLIISNSLAKIREFLSKMPEQTINNRLLIDLDQYQPYFKFFWLDIDANNSLSMGISE